jgi:hypothetical protein
MLHLRGRALREQLPTQKENEGTRTIKNKRVVTIEEMLLSTQPGRPMSLHTSKTYQGNAMGLSGFCETEVLLHNQVGISIMRPGMLRDLRILKNSM